MENSNWLIKVKECYRKEQDKLDKINELYNFGPIRESFHAELGKQFLHLVGSLIRKQ